MAAFPSLSTDQREFFAALGFFQLAAAFAGEKLAEIQQEACAL